MTKFYAQEKQVFDINKVTIVGSPTITSDGVIYNTSNADNYVLLPCDCTKDFTIELDYQDKNDGKYWWGFIVHGAFEIYHYQQGDKFQINWRNSGSNYKTICNIDYVSGATYHFQLKRMGNTVFVKVYINNVLNNEASLDITNMQVTNTNVRILNQNYAAQDSTLYKPIEVDLTTVKITQNGATFSPTKPVYFLERRKPKIWDKGQFTIVGNPSISDEGVVSGFSGSNYIRVPYRPLGQNFKIFTPKFNSSDVSQQQKMVRYSDGNIRIEIYQNKIRLFRYSGNNVYDLPKGETTLQNNTDYYYYVEQTTDGTNYYLKGYISTDNKNWTLDINKTYTSAMYDYQNNAPIQISGADASQPFIGTLGLKQFKIYTDNNLVFDGGADTYVYDASKFTVVGSPTITEYGVASGFDRTDYCKFSLDQIYKPFRITTKFTTPASFPTTNEAIFSLTLGWSNTYIFQKGTGIFAYFYFTDGMSISDKRYFTIQNSTTYYLALDFTGNKYNLYLSKDRATLYNNPQLVTEGNAPPVITQVTIGNHGEGSYPFNGSIDLADFSITVDGEEVFTGAKEKFYAMRGM